MRGTRIDRDWATAAALSNASNDKPHNIQFREKKFKNYQKWFAELMHFAQANSLRRLFLYRWKTFFFFLVKQWRFQSVFKKKIPFVSFSLLLLSFDGIASSCNNNRRPYRLQWDLIIKTTNKQTETKSPQNESIDMSNDFRYQHFTQQHWSNKHLICLI